MTTIFGQSLCSRVRAWIADAIWSAIGIANLVTVHPEIPGTKGHPDFLIERDDESFYLKPADLKSNRCARLPGGRMSLDEAKNQLAG